MTGATIRRDDRLDEVVPRLLVGYAGGWVVPLKGQTRLSLDIGLWAECVVTGLDLGAAGDLGEACEHDKQDSETLAVQKINGGSQGGPLDS